MNLVLLDAAELVDGSRVRITDGRARHISGVVKGAPGRQIRIGLVDGPFGVGTIQSVTSEAVELVCTFDREVPSRPPVDLLLALPRPKVLKRLWAQVAALGVGRIIVTNAGRVERNYFDTHVLDPDVYRPLLIEGLQQARDTRVPVVSVHRQFRVLIEDELDSLCPPSARLVAQPGAETRPETVVGGRPDIRAILAVGPEGGWNDFEIQLLESRGFRQIGLGTRTLRTDTACVALLAAVHGAIESAGNPPR